MTTESKYLCIYCDTRIICKFFEAIANLRRECPTAIIDCDVSVNHCKCFKKEKIGNDH